MAKSLMLLGVVVAFSLGLVDRSVGLDLSAFGKQGAAAVAGEKCPRSVLAPLMNDFEHHPRPSKKREHKKGNR
jgi:hypothetical protein